MDRDIEILLEIIADNLTLLKESGNGFDVGMFEDICDKLNWDLIGYLKMGANRPGRFRPNNDEICNNLVRFKNKKPKHTCIIEPLRADTITLSRMDEVIEKVRAKMQQQLYSESGIPSKYFDKT